MARILNLILQYIKSATSVTLLIVFIISGLYLLIIDGADLSTKKLKTELRITRIIGFVYIFGSAIAYVVIKFLL